MLQQRTVLPNILQYLSKLSYRADTRMVSETSMDLNMQKKKEEKLS